MGLIGAHSYAYYGFGGFRIILHDGSIKTLTLK